MKNGIVIFNINTFGKWCTPSNGYYFIVGIGKNFQRFDSSIKQVLLELEFQPFKDFNNTSIDIYLFKRNLRSIKKNKKNAYQGRTRSFIDNHTIRLRDVKASTIRETYVDWDNLNIVFPRSKLFFQISVEYYPSTPIVPIKADNALDLYWNKEHVSNKEHKDAVTKPLIIQNCKEKQKDFIITYSHTGKFKKIGNLFKTLFKGQECDNNGIPQFYEDTYLDIDNPNINMESQSVFSTALNQNTSNHSFCTEIDFPLDDKKYDDYQFNYEIPSITNEKDCKQKGDILPLGTAVPIFLNYLSNRVLYNEHINWTTIFEPMNVKVTGYLGNGKWTNSELSESLLSWYLQPHVKSLVLPRLPPKLCPRNILWEEYYLIDKQELITQYSTS
ncbi:similar to Torulaspora delbrueckii TDEL_0B04870 hypothetical protein [Maudiozyma barnettii]|uniref:Uncharacterized protein n=1 Tax=Maudiozyma barnettii TaxID=61262 RepID=A0A8H2ZEH8_9SACH|nr:uncharacterized protein KABA2_01S10406 [Kazachstania barnettii]CAB4252296.1 similar to Torulaspora delbrueckii TDEL_0B04870 hypothetical protein [Kazachstania barnettii]CAD1779011.1 similar to Torulaspora delbrueckii TDEL_0B04870 hypothetical protein [Kazachstania barnettii]